MKRTTSFVWFAIVFSNFKVADSYFRITCNTNRPLPESFTSFAGMSLSSKTANISAIIASAPNSAFKSTMELLAEFRPMGTEPLLCIADVVSAAARAVVCAAVWVCVVVCAAVWVCVVVSTEVWVCVVVCAAGTFCCEGGTGIEGGSQTQVASNLEPSSNRIGTKRP